MKKFILASTLIIAAAGAAPMAAYAASYGSDIGCASLQKDQAANDSFCANQNVAAGIGPKTGSN